MVMVEGIPTRRFVIRGLGAAALGALFSGCIGTASCSRCNESNRPTSAAAQDRFWNGYKNSFLKLLPDNRGTILVDESGSNAVSEGMGHALFFAAEREAWETFDSLLLGLSNFRKANGLFRWRINPDGSVLEGSENCATETEQNIANALLLAYEKSTNARYLNLGLEFLNNLWQNATINFQGRRILLPSDLTNNRYWPIEFNTEGIPCAPSEDGLISSSVAKLIFSPSYFSPQHGRRFAQYDTAHDWNKLTNDWYELMNMVFNAATQEPERFGVRGINPMPDFVKLALRGTNEPTTAVSGGISPLP
jgi:endoglucanase